jgi:hypothetical protein
MTLEPLARSPLAEPHPEAGAGPSLSELVARYRADGHATALGVFSAPRMDRAIAEVELGPRDPGRAAGGGAALVPR